MTPLPVPILSETSFALCVLFILLIPLACGGLALINAGLGRSRSAAHSLLASLCAFGVAALLYFVIGFSWQGYLGLPGHSLLLSGRGWNWIAVQPLFMRSMSFDGSPASLAAWLGLLGAGMAAMIPVGSGGDRWRFGAICASSALLGGLTYPLFAHWAWGGGWLAQLGFNCGLGRGFVDAGGSSTIHAVGGLTALSIAWILGPRRGKYSLEGMPTAIPGHNTVLVLFGCLLALAGWTGLNSAGAILFAGAQPVRVVLIAVNTMLAAVSAGLAAAAVTRVRFGKPDASLSANGWIGGLVAVSAGCAFMPPAAAVAAGLATGTLVVLSVEFLELRMAVDDPGGAISVHGVSGIWGILMAGLLTRFPAPVTAVMGASPASPGGDSSQWLAQLVGIATLLGCVFPLTYLLNWGLNRIYPQRASRDGERQGMDLHELGAGAYPEFVTHTDEFTQLR